MNRGGLHKAFAWSDRKRGEMPGDISIYVNAGKKLSIRIHTSCNLSRNGCGYKKSDKVQGISRPIKLYLMPNQIVTMRQKVLEASMDLATLILVFQSRLYIQRL